MDPADDTMPVPAEAGGELPALDPATLVRERDEALARLRSALAASEPGLDAAALAGSTLAELEASFNEARLRLAAAREDARRELAGRVPPAAPGWQQNAPATAFEKIRQGLGGGGL